MIFFESFLKIRRERKLLIYILECWRVNIYGMKEGKSGDWDKDERPAEPQMNLKIEIEGVGKSPDEALRSTR